MFWSVYGLETSSSLFLNIFHVLPCFLSLLFHSFHHFSCFFIAFSNFHFSPTSFVFLGEKGEGALVWVYFSLAGS